MKRLVFLWLSVVAFLFLGIQTAQSVYAVGPSFPPASWEASPGCNCDPSDDSPSEIDIIGCPAIFYHYDETTWNTSSTGYAYFREQVEGNPIQTNGTYKNSSWVVLYDTDDDSAYEVLVSLNGKPAAAANEKVELWTNAGTTTLVWSPVLNDPADTLRVSYSVATHSQVTPTGTAYFVDWAIPLSDLATWGVSSASTAIFFTTSQDGNNFNKDHPNCYECSNPTADAATDDADKCDDPQGGAVTFSLTGDPDDMMTYAWSTSDGGVNILSPSSQDTNVEVTGTGTVTITLTVTDENGCTDTDDVDLTVYTLPTADAATDDADKCDDPQG
ncbi:PKD domain-containing protein, partial [Chloroflexota bacterium]